MNLRKYAKNNKDNQISELEVYALLTIIKHNISEANKRIEKGRSNLSMKERDEQLKLAQRLMTEASMSCTAIMLSLQDEDIIKTLIGVGK